jgi:hypothetical protein
MTQVGKNMQLNQSVAFITGVLILAVMTACAPIKPNKPIHQSQLKPSRKELKLSEITMTFLGGNVQFPIHTTISLANYAAPTISYSKKLVVSPHRALEIKKALGDNAFQRIEKSWQADLRSQDFVDIANICEKLDIFTQKEVEWLAEENNVVDCTNSSDIQFYVRSQTGQENSFTIPGQMLCQEKSLPVGLKKLMGEVVALIPKYQPNSETQVARLY